MSDDDRPTDGKDRHPPRRSGTHSARSARVPLRPALSRGAHPLSGSPEDPLDTGYPPPAAPGGWEELNTALLRATGYRHLTRRLAWEWGLVFEARNLPYRFEHGFSGYRFFAPADRVETMVGEIVAYERENVEIPRPAPPMEENTAVTIGILLMLALFHGISRNNWRLFGFDAARSPIPWMQSGVCDCFDVEIGNAWWRTVTALTLHADVAHLLGNLGFGGIVMVLLCRELGSGAGWLAALLSGMAGNALNCALQGAEHASLGASTAVFGAIATLCTLRAVRDHTLDRRGLMAPLAAGVMLLGFLGIGGDTPFQRAPTDVGAHLFGFLSGIPIGALAGWLVRRHGPPHGRLSLFFGAIATGILILAWILALS